MFEALDDTAVAVLKAPIAAVLIGALFVASWGLAAAPDAPLAVLFAALGFLTPRLVARAITRLELFLAWTVVCFAVYVVTHGLDIVSARRFVQFTGGAILGATLAYYPFPGGLPKIFPWVVLALLAGVEAVQSGGDALLVSSSINRLMIAAITSYLILRQRTFGSSMALSLFLLPLVILATNSKAVVLAPIVSLLIATGFPHNPLRWRLRQIVTLMGGMLAIVSFVGVLTYVNPERLRDVISPTESISTMSRFALAIAATDAIADHPLFGLGPTGMNAPDAYAEYYSDDPIAVLIVQGQTRSQITDDQYTSGTHNMYLDIGASYGLVTLAMILGLLWRSGRNLRSEPWHHACWVTIVVAGMGWQYSTTAYGSALLFYAIVSGAPERTRQLAILGDV